MTPKREPNFLQKFWGSLGPGLITGAADDDPSGIATYSIAGAQLGTSLLWTSVITWPLMAAVQMMCARIGMVSGYGLGSALRRKFSAPVAAIASLALHHVEFDPHNLLRRSNEKRTSLDHERGSSFKPFSIDADTVIRQRPDHIEEHVVLDAGRRHEQRRTPGVVRSLQRQILSH